MEPESSIPNSQELSTCSYPEPDHSSVHGLYILKMNANTVVLFYLLQKLLYCIEEHRSNSACEKMTGFLFSEAK
jgi:hypothetical protein